mmetsp:Transcript_12388/g.29128  ORF Transcript_12388/g.29128 Transcript_12388/m.29128 type:complete len:630 (-) Transcript_12388:71-1960(-)
MALAGLPLSLQQAAPAPSFEALPQRKARQSRARAVTPSLGSTGSFSFGLPASAAAVGVVSAAALVRASLRPVSGQKGKKHQRALQRCRVSLAAAFDLEAWRKGWREYKELKDGYYFLDVADVPADLKGSYFRNGPGVFEVANVPVRHELDGDGVILGITFSGEGQVCIRHRLVQTQGYLREQRAKRIVSNGAYGTQAFGGLPFDTKKFRSKNTANSGCFWWQDKLLALWTYGKPHLIEPGSLGTQIGAMDSGATDLGGTVDSGIAFGDRARIFKNGLQSFSMFPTPLNTTVSFFDYKEDSWNPRYMKPRSVSLDGYTNIQDFGSTDKWFIIINPPLKLLDSVGAAFGKAANEVLDFDAEGQAQMVLATRDKEGEEVTIDLNEAISCSEIANSYELEDGSIVMDAVIADGWDIGRPSEEGQPHRAKLEDPAKLPRTRLVRYQVNPSTQAVTKTTLVDRHLGNVSVSKAAFGGKHSFVFFNTAHAEDVAGPLAGIGKVNIETGDVSMWLPGPAEFAGEPVFIPREDSSSEDDGYLLSVLFNGETEDSEVVILDAKSISEGPICRFKLQEAVPHGTRGCWVDGLTFTEEEMSRKMVLLRMFQRKAQTWNEMKTSFSLVGGNPFFDKQGGKLR